MNCPRCKSALNDVVYDDQVVKVCNQCGGEWLASGELKKILDHHNEIFTPAEIQSIDGVNKDIFTAERNDKDFLNCPQCDVQMENFNYGDTSGIILHRCEQCSGIWMDKDQLQKVEEVSDGWKASLDGDTAKYGSILDKVEAQEEADLEKDVSISHFGFVNSILRHFTQ